MASHCRLILVVCILIATSSLAPIGCTPTANEAASVKLCSHEVPERLCPRCTPSVKIDPQILRCKEHHDLPEEICTACHPELKAKYRTCAHELPARLCPDCEKKPVSTGAKK